MCDDACGGAMPDGAGCIDEVADVTDEEKEDPWRETPRT